MHPPRDGGRGPRVLPGGGHEAGGWRTSALFAHSQIPEGLKGKVESGLPDGKRRGATPPQNPRERAFPAQRSALKALYPNRG